MANEEISLLNWYRRYRVRAVDMNDFETAMVETARAVGEGVFQGGVAVGYEVEPTTGLSFEVSAGVALGPSGFALVKSDVTTLSVTAPSANPKRALLVARPLLVDTDLIVSPTDPFGTVPLKTQQLCDLVVIDGTESATPDFPAKQAGDLILAGFYLQVGVSTLAEENLDFTVREIPGKNSDIGQRTFMSDNRLRPYRSDYRTLAIKPSQIFDNKGPRGFLYDLTGKPSIFPKSGGGLFVNADSLYNFQTGAVTGGDAASSAFTPVIPTGNNAIVATVALRADNTIQVSYGTQGTRAQCIAAITNQVASGAGGIVVAAGSLKVAYVLVQSVSGAIADITVFDCRPLGGAGGGGGGGVFFDLFATDDGSGMLETRYAGQKVLTASTAFEQKATGVVKVPQSYNQGSQVRLRMKASIAATGAGETKNIRITSSLIRNGLDTPGAVINTQAVTAAFVANAISDSCQEVVATLTDVVGRVNSVAISAGDELEVTLEELANSTGSADLNIRQRSVEVTFS